MGRVEPNLGRAESGSWACWAWTTLGPSPHGPGRDNDYFGPWAHGLSYYYG
jgi:hypothetical protein